MRTEIQNNLRSFQIDFLRFIGLLLIVLAHVGAPYYIVQLRCFDVPLMVIVSALCFKPNQGSLHKYWIRRLKRLYYPTFIFLCLYFSLICIVKIIGINVPYSIEQIIGTFLLLEKPSIGYVWIIRVFILMAFVAPFIYLLVEKTSAWCALLIMFMMYGILEFLVKIEIESGIIVRFVFNEFIIYALGYSIILASGFWMKRFSGLYPRLSSYIGLLILIILICYMLIKKEIPPISQVYKYPPHGLYIIYGITIYLCLNLITFNNSVQNIFKKSISLVSSNSLWIYFWHIPFVVLLNSLQVFNNLWLVKWFVAFVFAIAIASAQVWCVKRFYSQNPNLNWLKYLIS